MIDLSMTNLLRTAADERFAAGMANHAQSSRWGAYLRRSRLCANALSVCGGTSPTAVSHQFLRSAARQRLGGAEGEQAFLGVALAVIGLDEQRHGRQPIRKDPLHACFPSGSPAVGRL